MKTEDILKWGAVAVAGWWLMGKINEPGGLSNLFGGGAAVPAVAADTQPQLPPAGQQVVDQGGQPVTSTPAVSLPVAAAQMLALVSPGQSMNFDHWNYYYNQTTGNIGPSPESVGIERQSPMPAITINQWMTAVGGNVDLSGFRNMGRLFNAIQSGGSVQ